MIQDNIALYLFQKMLLWHPIGLEYLLQWLQPLLGRAWLQLDVDPEEILPAKGVVEEGQMVAEGELMAELEVAVEERVVQEVGSIISCLVMINNRLDKILARTIMLIRIHKAVWQTTLEHDVLEN